MEYSIRLLSEDGTPISSEDVLAFYPNGTHAETRNVNTGGEDETGRLILILSDKVVRRAHTVSSTVDYPLWDRDALIPEEFEKMTILCAADHHKARTLKNLTLENTTEIRLQKLTNGGSTMFSDGGGSVPGFSGYIQIGTDDLGRLEIYARNISINDDPRYTGVFFVDDPLTLEDNNGYKIRLTLKNAIARSALVEYEWLSSDSPHPDLSTKPDDWEPLPIDREDPQHKEAVENVARALGDVIKNLRGNNQNPKECSEISEILETGKTHLETEDSIPKSVIRQIYDGLEKAGKIIYGTAKVIGVIGIALQALEWMVKILWRLSLPF